MKLLFVVLCVIVAQTASNGSQKLLLTVYYESKCSDSRTFIVDQLVPTVNSMHDYLQLKLIPFGKAHSVNKGINGFVCQHGPTECLGNIMQDCVIALMVGAPDTDILKYVACEMETQAGARGSYQCVQAANLPVQRVEQCLNSREGVNLQLQSEQLTHMLAPKFVPTVTFNRTFDQEVQDRAIEDLFATVCSFIPGAKPCSQFYNTSVLPLIINH